MIISSQKLPRRFLGDGVILEQTLVQCADGSVYIERMLGIPMGMGFSGVVWQSDGRQDLELPRSERLSRHR